MTKDYARPLQAKSAVLSASAALLWLGCGIGVGCLVCAFVFLKWAAPTKIVTTAKSQQIVGKNEHKMTQVISKPAKLARSRVAQRPRVAKNHPANTKHPASTKHVAKTQYSSPKPHYDFYSMLPNMEVDVSEHKPSQLHKPQQTAHKRSNSYLLQLGSFKQYASADRLKARLALAGVDVDIDKVKLSNGQIWYRVKKGHFIALADAQKEQQALKQRHIDAQVIKHRA